LSSSFFFIFVKRTLGKTLQIFSKIGFVRRNGTPIGDIRFQRFICVNGQQSKKRVEQTTKKKAPKGGENMSDEERRIRTEEAVEIANFLDSEKSGILGTFCFDWTLDSFDRVLVVKNEHGCVVSVLTTVFDVRTFSQNFLSATQAKKLAELLIASSVCENRTAYSLI